MPQQIKAIATRKVSMHLSLGPIVPDKVAAHNVAAGGRVAEREQLTRILGPTPLHVNRCCGS